MNKKLQQIALVTGCSSGLGFATVVKLIDSGYIVYAGMRSLEAKEILKKACRFSQNLHIRKLDLAVPMSISDLVRNILLEQGKIDVLINNASAVLLGPVDAATSEEVEYLFRVNVFGTLRLSQLIIPQMRKQKQGHIITIGSISGVESSAYLGIYAATKFAMEAIVGCWATTLRKWNIKISIIEAGAMNTDLPNNTTIGSYYDSWIENPYQKFNQHAYNFLEKCLKTVGKDPKEVADIILKVLKEPHPSLRYQTCEYSEMLVNKHLKDAKGNQWVDEHWQFIESWF